MHRFVPTPLVHFAEPPAQSWIDLRGGNNPPQQPTEIHTRPTYQDRLRPAPAHGFEHSLGEADETRQGEIVFRIHSVDEVVRDAGAFRGTRLGRGDIETTIDLQRVAPDELASQRFRESDCERGLTAGSGTDDGEKRCAV